MQSMMMVQRKQGWYSLGVQGIKGEAFLVQLWGMIKFSTAYNLTIRSTHCEDSKLWIPVGALLLCYMILDKSPTISGLIYSSIKWGSWQDLRSFLLETWLLWLYLLQWCRDGYYSFSDWLYKDHEMWNVVGSESCVPGGEVCWSQHLLQLGSQTGLVRRGSAVCVVSVTAGLELFTSSWILAVRRKYRVLLLCCCRLVICSPRNKQISSQEMSVRPP